MGWTNTQAQTIVGLAFTYLTTTVEFSTGSAVTWDADSTADFYTDVRIHPPAGIDLQNGVRVDGSGPDLAISADFLTLNGDPMGVRLVQFVSTPVDSSPVTSEDDVLVLANFIYEKDHAYRVEWGPAVSCNTGGEDGRFRVRKTGLGGLLLADSAAIACRQAGVGYYHRGHGYFKVGSGADVTAVLVLTLSNFGNPAIALTHRAFNTPRYLAVFDVGSRAQFLFAPTLV